MITRQQFIQALSLAFPKGQTNTKLNRAQKEITDEFYTLRETIDQELCHYAKHFKDQRIYLPADNPEKSNFWKHFLENYSVYGWKSVTCSYLDPSGHSILTWIDEDMEVKQCGMNGNGDFRSREVKNLMMNATMIVTNPPFSDKKFIDLLKFCRNENKKFIFIGPHFATTYKDVFNMYQQGEIFFGLQRDKNNMSFQVPESYTKGIYYKNGMRLTKKGDCCWFQNLMQPETPPFLELTAEYKPENYPQYLNYDAIHVDTLKNIPQKWDGKMGVPTTFLFYHNPEQFKILGSCRTVETTDGVKDFFIWDDVLKKPKMTFRRLVIEKVKDYPF